MRAPGLIQLGDTPAFADLCGVERALSSFDCLPEIGSGEGEEKGFGAASQFDTNNTALNREGWRCVDINDVRHRIFPLCTTAYLTTDESAVNRTSSLAEFNDSGELAA